MRTRSTGWLWCGLAPLALAACSGGADDTTGVASLEGEIATRHLLARMPDFVVDESRVKRLKSEFVSGIVGLPVHQE